jgi:flavodoxin
MERLVVYYTRTGKTKFVAEAIASKLGADIEEIVDLKKREGKLGWITAGGDALRKKLAEIAPTKKVPADYDLIVIGTPIWASSPTPAIRTYISQNNLSSKKVALFYTFDSGLKQAGEKTRELLPSATIVSELPIVNPSGNKEETEKKIFEWCNALKETS